MTVARIALCLLAATSVLGAQAPKPRSRSDLGATVPLPQADSLHVARTHARLGAALGAALGAIGGYLAVRDSYDKCPGVSLPSGEPAGVCSGVDRKNRLKRNEFVVSGAAIGSIAGALIGHKIRF